MIRITVFDQPIREQKGVGRESQKPYHLRIQTAYVHAVDKSGTPLPVPEKFEILLESDQAPYGAGDYTLHPSALYVDRQGRLAVAPRLTPIKAKTA